MLVLFATGLDHEVFHKLHRYSKVYEGMSTTWIIIQLNPANTAKGFCLRIEPLVHEKSPPSETTRRSVCLFDTLRRKLQLREPTF